MPYLMVPVCFPAAVIWIFGLPGNPVWWEMALWLVGFGVVTHYPIVMLVLGLLAWRARSRGDTARLAILRRVAWAFLVALLVALMPPAWVLTVQDV